jgi:nickel-dependent lactate racemase
MDVIGRGQAVGVVPEAEVESIVAEGLARLPTAGQRVLVIVPDGTRSFPLPLFFRAVMRQLRPQARAADVLVALGTHPPMSREALLAHVGLTEASYAAEYADVELINHAWADPDALVTLGVIPAAEIARLSGGRLHQDAPVRLNRLILDYDLLLICGPVFPHEVAGFSGGNKYFFPGIAGPDIIHLTHWLGALITSSALIGYADTPVRAVMNAAAALIPRQRAAICGVTVPGGVAGVFIGPPEAAFESASALSAQRHIRWTDRTYAQVLSVLPAMYDEIWVGSKGMYKTEPVVADGGEVILYAPHIQEISVVHGAIIRQIGYHVLDYFVKQWDQFKHLPLGAVAHSTHVKGLGTYENGIECPRIQVTLATGIPEDVCRQVNLGYRDPATINPDDFANREDEGILLVPHAGETLYRPKPGVTTAAPPLTADNLSAAANLSR